MNGPSTAPDVYVLLVTLGRRPGDGLPEVASGAAMLCYTAGRDEPEAVRETVAVLREAGLAPLDVEGHGTAAEMRADGLEIGAEEEALMARALAENAVIVAQMTPLFDA